MTDVNATRRRHNSLPVLQVRPELSSRRPPRATSATLAEGQLELIPSLNTSVGHGTILERGRLEECPPLNSPFAAHSMTQAPKAIDLSSDMQLHDDFKHVTVEGLEGDITRIQEKQGVATATPSSPPFRTSVFVDQEEQVVDLESLPQPNEHPVSVDRPETQMMMPLDRKSSRKLLFIDVHDTVSKSRLQDHETMNAKLEEGDSSTPLSEHRLRTLRRKKHINVLQASPSDTNAPEAFPVSIELHSSASKSSLKSIRPTFDDAALSQAPSQQSSVDTDDTDSPATPSTSAEMPASASPNGLLDSPISSSSIRIGHPSRPYYSAIRKNGMSPTSSRPISGIGSLGSLASRRQSLTPSVAAPLAATSKRLSMSTMFYSPAYSLSTENAYSVFTLDDDVLDNAASPALPPTPAPETTRFSFSLPRRKKSVRAFPHSEQPTTISYSKGLERGYRGSGVGFSMSGQTELRMALAEGAASAGITKDEFRFSTTPPVASPALDTHASGASGLGRQHSDNAMEAASWNAFMGRVRKVRRGLTDIFFTTSTTT